MSTAKFDTLSNLAGTQTVPVSTVAQGSAKAWVNIDGTGTVSIRASFNVSSITDNGVGDYTVNFTTAMADVNYAVLGSSSSDATFPNFGNADTMRLWGGAGGVNTTNVRMFNTVTNASINDAADRPYLFVSIFR